MHDANIPIDSVHIEGLLLLISLTESNADLQKIVAFENAFERLLAIIEEEGAISGGIIVQDCLQLVQNLLRYNVSNQVRSSFFKELLLHKRTYVTHAKHCTAFSLPLHCSTTASTVLFILALPLELLS